MKLKLKYKLPKSVFLFKHEFNPDVSFLFAGTKWKHYLEKKLAEIFLFNICLKIKIVSLI